MECVELAPAFEPRHTSDSGSKLHALHTLRETRPPLSSVCAIWSVSPENLRKKTRFSPILFSAPPHGQIEPGALRTDAPYPPSLIAYARFYYLLSSGFYLRYDLMSCMRWRPFTWLLLSLLFFVAAAYFWRLGDEWELKKAAPTSSQPTNQAEPP